MGHAERRLHLSGLAVSYEMGQIWMVGFLAWTATSVFRPITTSGEIRIWGASSPGLVKTAHEGRVERVTTVLVRGKAHLKRGRSGSVLGGGAGPVTHISLGALRGERV